MQSAIVVQPTPITVDGASGPLDVLEIRLVGEPRGLVVFVCASGRLHLDAAEVMNAIAEHGFASLAVDLSGEGLTDQLVVSDLKVLIDRAVAEGWEPDQIGLVGYETGGRAALLGAMEFDLGAAVSVSPTAVATVRPSARRSGMQTPWHGMFGEKDPAATSAEILALYGHLRGYSSAYVSVVSYDAGPDFFRDSSDAVVHAAAFDSWQRTVEWLNLRVAPGMTPLALAWREKVAAGEVGG